MRSIKFLDQVGEGYLASTDMDIGIAGSKSQALVYFQFGELSKGVNYMVHWTVDPREYPSAKLNKPAAVRFFRVITITQEGVDIKLESVTAILPKQNGVLGKLASSTAAFAYFHHPSSAFNLEDFCMTYLSPAFQQSLMRVHDHDNWGPYTPRHTDHSGFARSASMR
mmetsp:Transcript_17482/g.48759  ORF Transcript_17482/g.48759 Transcript_17482/m.48759 type:complete len:167 (-) Transcript_17482:1110-1610(-)